MLAVREITLDSAEHVLSLFCHFRWTGKTFDAAVESLQFLALCPSQCGQFLQVARLSRVDFVEHPPVQIDHVSPEPGQLGRVSLTIGRTVRLTVRPAGG